MKKIFSFVLMLGLIVGIAGAYPVSTGIQTTDMPATGMFKVWLSSNQAKGSVCQIGSNRFEKCLYVGAGSGATTINQGEPVFDKVASADGYTVTTMESSAYTSYFKGVMLCDQYGAASATYGKWIWVQTRGVANAYVTNTGGSIVIGDILGPYGTVGSYNVLIHISAALTSTATAEWCTNPKAIALEAMTSGTAATIKVLLK